MTINTDGDPHGALSVPPSPFIPPMRAPESATASASKTPATDLTAPQVEPQPYELYDRDDAPFDIYGRLLGFSSSRWDDHSHAPYFSSNAELAQQLPEIKSRLFDLTHRYEQGSISENVYRTSKEQLDNYSKFFGDDFGGYPENVRRYAGQGERCSACRWFELRIFAVDGEYTDPDTCNCAQKTNDPEFHTIECGLGPARSRYLVLTYGRSEVPGEMNKRRAVWTDSPYEVLSLLTQRQRSDGPGNAGTPFLPATSDRALAQAAAFDPGIENAYNNRKVR